jgi:Mrp family chromosome partitioning ATPase
MPPGTGDVPLTVFQSLPLDGIVIVTSPQDLVSMIVEKAVNMASLMDVKILGLVENYSYIVCPDCGKVIRPYGESKIESLAENYKTQVLAKLPIDPELASLCDKGVIELYEGDYLEKAADIIEKL